MRPWERSIVALSAAAILTGGIVAASPPEAAYAQEDMAVTCADELNLTAPSTEQSGKVPVVLVHGRGGEPEAWLEGESPMKDALDSIDGAVIVPPFDYKSENTKWVANSDAAHRLAKTIVCYFLLYGEKLAVGAHSMGGPLTWEALDWSAYGVHVRDAVGHIFTIGSPFKGSWLASGAFETAIAFCKLVGLTPAGRLVMEELCREANSDWSSSGLSYDSDQLEALPDLPEGITHKAIAGRIQMEVCFFGCVPFSIGDGVVPSESATARYTDTGVGDGVTVFDCTISEGAWCAHSSMLQAERVQQEVKASIEAYLASVAEPEFNPDDGNWWTFFDKLAIPYLDQNWGGAMSEPEYYVSMRDFSDCPDGTNAGCPAFYFTNIDTIPTEYNDPVVTADEPVIAEFQKRCEADRDTLWDLLEPGVMNIGDKIAEFYTLEECPTSEYGWDTMWLWYVEEEGVLVTANNTGEGTIDMEVMEESFRQAVWF